MWIVYTIWGQLYKLIPDVRSFHEFIDHLKEKQYIYTGVVQMDFLLMGMHLLSNWFQKMHVQKISVKLNTLTRVSGYMNPDQKRLIMNALFLSNMDGSQ